MAEDLIYEEGVLRNPHSVKSWWYFVDSKVDAPRQERYLLFERALQAIPRSYKLWVRYLEDRSAACGVPDPSGRRRPRQDRDEPRDGGNAPGATAANGDEGADEEENGRTDELSREQRRDDGREGEDEPQQERQQEAPQQQQQQQPEREDGGDDDEEDEEEGEEGGAGSSRGGRKRHRMRSRRALTRAQLCPDREFEATAAAYERALVHLGTMPRLWQMYTGFLAARGLLTRTRHAFDRALQSLAVTQHSKIWPAYLGFVRRCGVPETALRVGRRYLKVDPGGAEEYVRFLKQAGRLAEAARVLARLLENPQFVPRGERTRHDLWLDFVRLVTRHPDEMAGVVDVEAVVRAGMRRYANEAGMLWNALASFYTRQGHLDRARDVYEEGVRAACTVRDFSLVFDAYSRFEEQLLAAETEAAEEEEARAEAGEPVADPNDEDAEYGVSAADRADLRLARLEDLAARRPALLNGVLLRQNPHNVAEWHARAKLFDGDPERQARVYSDAVSAVDAAKATGGRLASLWVAFAALYERELGDLAGTREVMERAVRVRFTGVEELAGVWCAWIEAELRHGEPKQALALARRAVALPPGWRGAGHGSWKEGEDSSPPQERLWRSTRLWCLLADLEENLGTLDSTRAVYERMFELKVVTPQAVLACARLMEEHRRFEEMFRVFEKGTEAFPFPNSYPIWRRYLTKFLRRFGGAKIERARELFEQAIAAVPAEAPESRHLYMRLAAFEERHGLARRAMQVYDRACRAAPPAERLALYIVYVDRAAAAFGPARTREIYEQAMKELPDADVVEVCSRYAALEVQLGELERARAVFIYGAQFCDQRVKPAYWKSWHEFEVNHGNTDTFTDMMRIRRTVATKFAHTSTVAALLAGSAGGGASEVHPNMVRSVDEPLLGRKRPRDAMAALEDEADAAAGSPRAPAPPAAAAVASAPPAVNADEIELDEDS